jgi:hypothetical protein
MAENVNPKTCGSPLDAIVSLFPNAFAKTPSREVTIREFLAGIQSGTYKGQIDPLRKLVDDGEIPAYMERKKRLPGISLSARVTTRAEEIALPEKLISHSHVIQVDGDDIPDIQGLLEKFKKDPYVLFAYRSPSGKGLKACVRINGTQHLASFQSAEKYFLEQYGVSIDTSVKDVVRLCFASYDPDLYINEAAQILPITNNGTKPAADNAPPKQSYSSSSEPGRKLTYGERALDTARKMIEQAADGKKYFTLLRAGKLLGGYVAGGMLSEGDAQGLLRDAIKNKPNVNCLKTAYKAVDDSLKHGQQNPIGFEDLERQRIQYLETIGYCRSVWPKDYYEQTPSNARAPECSEILTGAEFPFSALSGLALRFAELFSSYTEPPLQFYYFSFLTCLGSVLADKVTLESQIEPQPRLNTLLLGESADDRKSTAIDQTVKFFHGFSIDKILTVCHGLGSAEGLQARMDEIKGPGGIAKLLLIFDEFKSFVSKCKIEGSVLLPCCTTLFESNRYESRTKHSNIQLDNAYLSLLAASTLQTFQNIWTSQFTDIGFGNRLWIVTGSGERRFSIPRKIPERDLYHLKDQLNEILGLFRERIEMPVDLDAFELFDKWYLGLESSVHTKRIDTYALRLMPLLAANEAKSHVDVETVQKVIQLSNWQLQTRKLHDPIDCDNNIAKMEEKIRRNLRSKGPLPEWRLKQAVSANRDGLFVFNNALKNLQRAREVQWDKSTRCYFGGCNEIS